MWHWYSLLEQQRQALRWWSACSSLAPQCWCAALPGMHGKALLNIAQTAEDWLEPWLGPSGAPPRFDIATVNVEGTVLPVSERVVAAMPFCRLRLFVRDAEVPPAQHGRAILLCAPLAGHAAVMIRETVETLLEDGDVYVTDWLNARDVPLSAGRFNLDDYVTTLVGFVERIASACDAFHIIAVCQATNPALAALALLAQRPGCLPRSLTLIGGPIDARRSPTALTRFASTHSAEWFCANTLDTVPAGFAGTGRQVFPAYLQQAELATAYPRHYLALIAAWNTALACHSEAGVAAVRRSLREYAAFLDMPAEYFVDTIDVVFRHAHLATGTWRVGKRLIRPEALHDIALLTVEGSEDDVSGSGQTHAAHALCGGIAASLHRRLDVAGCDHYGLFSGACWRGEIHCALRALFAQSEAARVTRPGRHDAARRRAGNATGAHQSGACMPIRVG